MAKSLLLCKEFAITTTELGDQAACLELEMPKVRHRTAQIPDAVFEGKPTYRHMPRRGLTALSNVGGLDLDEQHKDKRRHD